MSLSFVKGHTSVRCYLILLKNGRLTRRPLASFWAWETVTMGVCFLSQSI